MIIPKLATVSTRCGISQEMAEVIYIRKITSAQQPPAVGPWASQVGQYVIGQSDNHEYMTIFELPFNGHADDWQVIEPILNADDLLRQLKGIA